MALYKIVWKESVRKDLQHIPPKIVSRIIQKIESFSHQPIPVGTKKLKDTQHTFRVRIGDYRIIYQMNQSEKEITICRVRHRKDVYRF